jgi:hypothetical protein
MKNAIISIWKFYADGFRNMTWGRQLWWLILLKVVILFLLLRGFFFKPVLSGKSDDERSEYVGAQLIDTQSELRTKI